MQKYIQPGVIYNQFVLWKSALLNVFEVGVIRVYSKNFWSFHMTSEIPNFHFLMPNIYQPPYPFVQIFQ